MTSPSRPLLAIAVALASSAAVSRADEPVRDYIVVAGDTCLGIAARELGDPRMLEKLHQLNPQLGKTPHKLVVGQILKLPGAPSGPDAHLTALRGLVEVRPSGRDDWQSGTLNQQLFRAWRVGTRDRATAKVEFVDRSTIDMREDTVVIIFGPTAGRQPVLRTSLERGTLRTRLAALDRDRPTRVAIETSGGTAEVASGSAIVDVDRQQETRVANHAGDPAKLANPRGRVEIAAGYGARAVADRAPTPPVPLLAPPRWTAPGALALAWQGDPPVLRGAWEPVPGATRYRLEISRADSPLVVEAFVEVPSTITKLEATNLPIGNYVVTAASVDANGLEGAPSPPLLIQAIELERPQLRTGAAWTAPAGLACAMGSVAPESPTPTASELLVLRYGNDPVARISCRAAAGIGTIALAIPSPRAALPIGQPPLTRGERHQLAVELTSIDPQALRAFGSGVTVLGATFDQRDRTTAHLSVVAPRKGTATIYFALARGPQLVVVASQTIEVVEPVAAPAPSIAWGVTAYGGGTVARQRDSGLIGGELVIAPSRWLGGLIGIDKVLDDGDGTLRLGVRTALRGGLSPVARFALAIGAKRVTGDLSGGVEWTIAHGFAISANLGIALQASDPHLRLTGGVTWFR